MEVALWNMLIYKFILLGNQNNIFFEHYSFINGDDLNVCLLLEFKEVTLA
jgi:hypothetical protein